MTRTVFRQEMNRLASLITNLGHLVESQIKDSVESLINADIQMAEDIINRDKELDELKLEIEDLCIKLLALQQPMGPDLRFITTILKIITDFDRMADRSRHISEITLIVAKKPKENISKIISEMCEQTLKMVHKVMVCLENKERESVEIVGEMDDVVDRYQEQCFDTIVEHMRTHPQEIDIYVYILLVPRHLERIADHSTNIASRIIYMIKGERVKIN